MKKKILFVDDEQNLLDSLKRSLRNYSHEWAMDFANSAGTAINLMDNDQYDIIVSDYKMPAMDGLELLAYVKENYPDTRRILLTGQSDTETYNTSKEIVNTYLSKPCDHEELISILKQ